MNRDFEKARRRDLSKRDYDPIASFRPANKSNRFRSRAARAFYTKRRHINEQLQRACWPQKFLSVAGEKTGKPDLNGNTHHPCGDAGTAPEVMGNPRSRKNT